MLGTTRWTLHNDVWWACRLHLLMGRHARSLCHWSRNAAIISSLLTSFHRREVLRHDHKVPVITVSFGPSIISRRLSDSCCDRYYIILNNLGCILSSEVIACHKFPVDVNSFTLINHVLVSSPSHKVVSIDWYTAWTLEDVWTCQSIHYHRSSLDNSCSLRSYLRVVPYVIRHLFDTRLNT